MEQGLLEKMAKAIEEIKKNQETIFKFLIALEERLENPKKE